MKILIVSGLSEKDIGGPAQYGENLKKEFLALGHKARLVSYGVERLLPVGIRHMWFLLRILPRAASADKIIALDTFSAGVPAVFAGKVFRKKIVVRIGGDFLWEAHVNKTGNKIILREFYESMPALSLKEKTILYFTRILVEWADILAFNTEWQKGIWSKAYGIGAGKSKVVRNFIPAKQKTAAYSAKNFVWAGRDTKVKNLELLKSAARKVKSRHPEFRLDILMAVPHEEVISRLKDAYAAILPSLSDVCPNFILEAASFNKPFIMTQETGLGEIYDKGGIYVDPLIEEDLEAAIENMLDSVEYHRLAGELGSINPGRSWEEAAQDFASL
jgi:glycosyltransferase involved in cell wall biosynthesis